MNSDDKKFAALAQALRQAEESRRVFIPPNLDEAILKKGRERFAAPNAFRSENPVIPNLIRVWRLLAGATALACIAFYLAFVQVNQQNSIPSFAREDINRDGQVDILDALALAKLGETAPANLDQNGDRRIDGADIDSVAMAAVRLNRKPGS